LFTFTLCARNSFAVHELRNLLNGDSNFKLNLDINKLEDADDAVVAYFMELSKHMSV